MDARNRRIKFIATGVLFTILLTIVLLVSLLRVQSSDSPSPNKLMLISLDGFHYRYLEQFPNETRFIREHFAEKGVHAVNGMKSVFATKTFAIHWTLATGLYEESHGILANDFFDPDFNETFGCMAVNESKWFDGEPIWSVAQKQGRRVGVSQWMGSSAKFQKDDNRQSPLFLDPHETCHSALEIRPKLNIVYDFLFQKNCDFAMLYFYEPDSSGHWFGAGSDGVGEALAKIDAALEYFVSRIRDQNVNIIILSGSA